MTRAESSDEDEVPTSRVRGKSRDIKVCVRVRVREVGARVGASMQVSKKDRHKIPRW